MKTSTPLMRQYQELKSKYPDAILLFRVGDFYETFGEDAVRTSQALNITLTKRNAQLANSEYLAGFPYHALDTYLYKLSRSGYRIAICEQVEDPKLAKGLVKRAITELITPGTTVYDKILDGRQHNFLAGFLYMEKGMAAIAFAEVSTGEFWVAEGDESYIDRLLQTMQPAEVLISKSQLPVFQKNYKQRFFCYPLEEWVSAPAYATEILLDYFLSHSLKGFGIDTMKGAVIAAGMVLHYLREMQHLEKHHFSSIQQRHPNHSLWLDKFSIQHLDILPSENRPLKHSLVGILDHTHTAMGGRLLRQWLLFPLNVKENIEQRLAVVAELLAQQEEVFQELTAPFKECGDLERAIMRISIKKTNPRELYRVGTALSSLLKIAALWQQLHSAYACHLCESLALHKESYQYIADKILRTLVPQPPLQLHKTPCIQSGINPELDELRSLLTDSKTCLRAMQDNLAQATGITSLKISYNNVFGYYIEVPNTHKSKVPQEWERRQTLTQSERYITEELKNYERKILTAEEKIASLEEHLYLNLVQEAAALTVPVQQGAHTLAVMDCLQSFARSARLHNYVQPTLHEGSKLELYAARHPVLEQNLDKASAYTPNTLTMDAEEQQIMLITGPNMSGKSALLRQTALITLMAHAGCFVPCDQALIPLTDKIFTRVGASDNLSSGESTFMVEMNETARIVNNISPRTLVLLDEVGRGTSTYDGVAIASSVLAYLHEHPHRPKVLFATHYHELSELENEFPRLHNYHISYEETKNNFVFLRTLKKGASKKSFGIQVAKMAGLPSSIIQRATQILHQLEAQHTSPITYPNAPLFQKNAPPAPQKTSPLLQEMMHKILSYSLNNMCPLDALLALSALQEWIKKEKNNLQA